MSAKRRSIGTTKTSRKSCAIIGAGIGGLTAALGLARAGHDVTLYEQANELAEIGAGLQLSPNAAHVLHALGLEPALARAASVPERLNLRDGLTGGLLAEIALNPQMGAQHGAPFYQIHRADLVRLLSEAARSAGVDLRFGVPVETSQPNGEFLVGDEAVTKDCIIVANGIKSDLRARCFGGEALQYSGQSAYRVIIPAELGRPDAANWLAPGRHVITYPLRSGSATNIVAVTDAAPLTPGQWSEAVEPSALNGAFSDFAPELREVLAEADTVTRWGLFKLGPLKTFAHGRMALLGDAAHPTLPYFAQGAAMAIEDAWALVAALDHLEDVGEALELYSKKRLVRTTKVQQASARNGQIYHASGLVRAGRNVVMQGSTRLGLTWMQARQNWLYGYNIVTEMPMSHHPSSTQIGT